MWDIEFIELEYKPKEWLKMAAPYENEPERGKRCSLCFEFRLKKAMEYALSKGYRRVASVLGVSRWKNLAQVNAAAARASASTGAEYIEIEGRRHGMQEARARLIKELNLYNQTYCGCIYSLKNERQKSEETDSPQPKRNPGNP